MGGSLVAIGLSWDIVPTWLRFSFFLVLPLTVYGWILTSSSINAKPDWCFTGLWTRPVPFAFAFCSHFGQFWPNAKSKAAFGSVIIESRTEHKVQFDWFALDLAKWTHNRTLCSVQAFAFWSMFPNRIGAGPLWTFLIFLSEWHCI